MRKTNEPDPWAEIDGVASPADGADELALAFARCFAGGDGLVVVEHLQRTFLLRRVPPTASDSELRHVEGQRSVVAHILSLIDRGRTARRSADQQRIVP